MWFIWYINGIFFGLLIHGIFEGFAVGIITLTTNDSWITLGGNNCQCGKAVLDNNNNNINNINQ